jgi:hypothetical protein
MTTSLPDQPIDEDYHVRYWTWNTGEQLTFAYKVFAHQGMVAVCGARAESPGGGVHQRTFNSRALQTLYLTLAGEVLLNDISFFNKARYVPDEGPEGTASCVRTDDPWGAFYDEIVPELEAAKTRFIVRD